MVSYAFFIFTFGMIQNVRCLKANGKEYSPEKVKTYIKPISFAVCFS